MILAIDPGIKGATALYDPDLNFLYTEPLQTQWHVTNKQKRYRLDVKALDTFLKERKEYITSVVLEDPSALPGQGVVSTFSFGRVCGQIEALLIANGYTFRKVAPSRWKSAMVVSSDKFQSRKRAMEFFPAHKDQFKQAKDDGRAEAAMLALYVHNAATNTAPVPVVEHDGEAIPALPKRQRKAKSRAKAKRKR